jgi:predicted lipid-binding transport protein (Tim44 family)
MKFSSFLLVCLLALTGVQVEAKRFGAGRSMGQQSGNVTNREATRATTAKAPQAAPSVTPSSPPLGKSAMAGRSWGGMLAGVAAGLGLAWLAHTMGLGAEFGQFLMLGLAGLVLMMALGLFMRRRAMQHADAHGGGNSAAFPDQMRAYNPAKIGNDASARPWEQQASYFDASSSASRQSTRIGASLIGHGAEWTIPDGFDAAGFVAAAKQNFISLQAAWDRADIPALRIMMTDNMVAEIQSQLAERTLLVQGPNTTEVVMLEAQLLGIEDLGEGYMASIEFSGMIREDPASGPNPFREVWNMTKPKQGSSGWLVAGVQALQ